VALVCGACTWQRRYRADAMARRLDALGSDGRSASLHEAAQRVAWPCPRCARMRWWCKPVTGEGMENRVSLRRTGVWKR
jgi:hypothetical protein